MLVYGTDFLCCSLFIFLKFAYYCAKWALP